MSSPWPMCDVVGDNWSHKRIFELSMKMRARHNLLASMQDIAIVRDWNEIANALESGAAQIKALGKKVRRLEGTL